jgi:hypothetical protein
MEELPLKTYILATAQDLIDKHYACNSDYSEIEDIAMDYISDVLDIDPGEVDMENCRCILEHKGTSEIAMAVDLIESISILCREMSHSSAHEKLIDSSLVYIRSIIIGLDDLSRTTDSPYLYKIVGESITYLENILIQIYDNLLGDDLTLGYDLAIAVSRLRVVIDFHIKPLRDLIAKKTY